MITYLATTIVTPSAHTAQLLALIAAFVFAVAALVALGTLYVLRRTYGWRTGCAGCCHPLELACLGRVMFSPEIE